MRYFKYWVREKTAITIGGKIEEISILSGSNASKADASAQAKNSAQLIERRISGGSRKKDYEVPIREHICDVIDDSNIVSVCRYGAKILNTNQYTILDLDDYPIDLFDLFKSYRKMTKKERIVVKFLQRLKKYPQLGSDFRIYETAKGVRVIGRKYIDPAESKYTSLMRKLYVDWIYIQLSKKQKCYRARLTPKPHRMKFKTIRVKDPLVCETDSYREWEQDYMEKSKAYRVVKLVQRVGRDFSRDPVVKYHDAVCNIDGNGALA